MLVKIDAYGDMEWSQTFRESSVQTAYSLIQTSDGGYAMAGYIWPSDSKSSDFLLVKTDAYGNIEWNQTYNGGTLETAYSLVETSDGGYAIAGGSYSGVINSWLVKTDRFGNMEWNKTYAGENTVWERELVVTYDGGFAIAGGGVLVKTDASGNMEWNQTFGGESIVSLVQVSDGGYALAGSIQSIAGDEDFWLVKTDANGNIEWNQTHGGENDDGAYSLVGSSDGGYAIAGYTESFGAGKADFWLIKTDEYGIIPEFPSWGVLPLFLTVTMVVAIYKKRLPKTSNN